MTKTIGLKPVGDDPKPQIWGEMFSGMLPTKPQRLQIGIAQTERSPLRSMQRQMDLESSFQWMRSMSSPTEASVQASLLAVPASKPRTKRGCHPVSFEVAAMVVLPGA